MALSAVLIGNGYMHAVADGTITVGVGVGQVAGLGLNQLMKLPLPFGRKVYDISGFENQLYSTSKAIDSSISDIRLDATPIEYDPITGQPIARYRVDISAAPAPVLILVESHHTAGR